MEKIKLMVCPHDTARNPERWVFFAQHLGKLCNKVMSFKASFDFKEFHTDMSTSGLIYANPQDSLSLYTNHDYLPIARPQELYDEVVIIANQQIKNKELQHLNHQQIASVVTMMPTALAIKYLQERNIHPEKINNCETWLAVMRAVSIGKYPFGFVYKDFYDGLTRLSRSTVDFVDATVTKELHHIMMLSPEHKDSFEHVQDILFSLHTDEKAGAVMKELNIRQFEEVSESTMKTIASVGSVQLKCDCPHDKDRLEVE